jgi:4-hydroxybenzoate polyprenyltransferase
MTSNSIIYHQRLFAYLQLMRPANIVTAWADVLVGFSAAGVVGLALPKEAELPWLLLATTGLYGGGIVFNDVFDAKIDAQERPDRPIPSGKVSDRVVIWLGTLLFSVGIIAAAQVSLLSAMLACGITLAALLYDSITKHHLIAGPFNMGFCRGTNWLLGVSAIPSMVGERWFLALIPITYVAAITTLSRGEVQGSTRRPVIIALSLICVVIAGLLGLGLLKKYQVLTGLPFLSLFAILVLSPTIRSLLNPTAQNLQTAVKTCVLSLIVLDATVATGFSNWFYGLLILSLLPISTMIAKFFDVT